MNLRFEVRVDYNYNYKSRDGNLQSEKRPTEITEAAMDETTSTAPRLAGNLP
jgi:hypothetical protein